MVQPGVIHLSMEEYIDSKLSPVSVGKELKKNPERALADRDVELLRTLVMKIMWLARQCRPDLQGVASVLARNLGAPV
eukprot:3872414-Amphidinium_carterae.1